MTRTLGMLVTFLQGAWPFGLVEAVWSGVALRRWWLERHATVIFTRRRPRMPV